MINSVVNQRWKLVKSIGKGGYGEIFAAQDLHSDRKVAVKIENNKHKRQALKMEKTVLARFKNSPYAPDYIEFGKLADSHYLVMELLGSNFSNLRRNEPNGVFSLPTTLNLAIHMVGAIEDLHATGFIHRDIQPGNFAIRKPNHKESKCPHCVLFDYGLARRHLNEDKKPRRPRSRAGFRGTTKFASLQAHLSKEQSRRDDLWSLLFTLIEFLTRKLPWKNVKEKEKIIELKKEYSSEKLVATLPHEFASFIQHLNSLNYESMPNYSLLKDLMRGCLKRYKISEKFSPDWQISADDKKKLPYFFDNTEESTNQPVQNQNLEKDEKKKKKKKDKKKK